MLKRLYQTIMIIPLLILLVLSTITVWLLNIPLAIIFFIIEGNTDKSEIFWKSSADFIELTFLKILLIKDNK